ncbi:FKBP-type peptidyl-prolyl cis-trans isomerase [Crocinitomix algicola]|uniref:FKBP-type peptidyl-prolyl cis-trans isomerase n=1 Tax=Crocinitomix algicola TaxID=1740263 RepID=UPI0008335687|nr:FKBP-type peptidyl-prolyl cis-trans isomerase [Crocinitomix algicola]
MEELKKEASYGVGMSIGQSLQGQNLDEIDLNSFMEGIQAIFNNDTLKFSPEEANQKISAYINEMNTARYAGNKKAGEEFLAENAKKPSVTTLPSGLQYEIIEEGNGEKPNHDSQVTVHYHGTLTDGTVFDSSISRGTPATFGVNQVIKGWTEALQLMPTGAKWKLYIPENLAYGATPHPGGPIKPYMALIFDVELISIN